MNNIPQFTSQPDPDNFSELATNFCSLDINNNNLKDTNQSNSVLKGRKCNFLCKFPPNWGTRLYKTLQLFKPCYLYKDMQNNILQFENCEYCHSYINETDSNGCPSIEICFDNIKYLNNLSVHFHGLRTLLRKVYSIRRIVLDIIELENDILNGNLSCLQFLTTYSESTDNDIHTTRGQHGAVTEANFKNMLKNYHSEFDSKLDTYSCMVCSKLFQKNDLTTLNDAQIKNHLFLESRATFENNFICKRFCYNAIFQNHRIPI